MNPQGKTPAGAFDVRNHRFQSGKIASDFFWIAVLPPGGHHRGNHRDLPHDCEPMNTPIAYLNGQYLPIEQAHLHVFDLGVVGGVSVTEMTRTFRHVPFLLDQHLDRLVHSLEVAGIDVTQTKADFQDICEEVVRQNAPLIPAEHDLGLTVFATAGQNLTYLGRREHARVNEPTVCVHSFPLPFELWADSYDAGLHLVTVNTRSIPDDVIDPRIKHRSRLHWHLAAREARQIDPHAMAILEDDQDQLTETATGNVCVVDGTTIISPAGHVLAGISREYLAKLASQLGLSFIHAPVTAEDLSHADEALLTSTPPCALPITRFNQKPIGSGQPGPVYRQLMDAWSKSVGLDIIDQMRRGAIDRR